MSRRSKAAREPSTETERPSAGELDRPAATSPRPVVSVALVLFVPVLWLVMQGDLSVQTALIRFIGALLASWVAVRLVLTPVSHYTKPDAPGAGAAHGADAADPAGSPGTSGLETADPAQDSDASAPPGGSTGAGRA